MNALSRPGPGGRPRALKAIPRPKEPGDTPVESVTSGSSPLAPFVGPGPAAGPRGPAGPSTAQDVPTDGNSYLRSDAGWVSGGRVANELTVAQDPAKPLGVATKQYVDNSGAVPPFLATKAYAVGDLALYNSVIYCCDTATGPGAFRNPDWRAQTRRNFLAGNTLYADAAIGDDVYGDGSVDKPFKTLAQICAYACNEFDRVGYELDIIMGVGSYGAGTIVGSRNQINITGAGIDQTFITYLSIGDNNGNEVSTYLAPGGFTIVPPAYYPAVSVSDGGSLYLDSYGFAINLDNTDVPHYGVIGISSGGMIYKAASIQIRQNGIVDSSTSVISVSGAGSYFYDMYDSWVLSGSPNTYNAFLSVSNRGTYINSNGAPFTGTGIIGKQYNIVDNALAKVDPTSLAALLQDHPPKGPVPEISVSPEPLVVPGTTSGTVDGTSTYNGAFGGLTSSGGLLNVKASSGSSKFTNSANAAGLYIDPSTFNPGQVNLTGYLDHNVVGSAFIVRGYFDTNPGWYMYLPNATPTTGGNAGADFDLIGHADNGAALPTALHIERATGNVTLAGNLIAPNIRKVLTADLDLYVSATGNDATGDGTTGTPWATLQKACDYASAKLDFATHTVIVHIGAGNFATASIGPLAGTGTLSFWGAGSAQTIIVATPYNACVQLNNVGAVRVGVNHVTLVPRPDSEYYPGVSVYGDGILSLASFLNDSTTDIIFSLANAPLYQLIQITGLTAQVLGGGGGPVTMSGTGNIGTVISVTDGLYTEYGWWSIPPGINITGNFLSLSNGRYVNPGWYPFIGTFTGKQYRLASYSSVTTGGLGQSMIPGTIPGTLDASSSYDGVMGLSARTLVKVDTTYNVSTTGNDTTGDGSAAKPWATLQKAIDRCATLDFGGHTIIITLAAGSFVGPNVGALVGGGILQIYGAGSTLTTITNNSATQSCLFFGNQTATKIGVNGVALNVNSVGVYLVNGAQFGFGDVIQFDALTDIVVNTLGGMFTFLYMAQESQYTEWGYKGSVTIAQNGIGAYYCIAADGGCLVNQSVKWILTGTPNNYGYGFIALADMSYYVNGSSGITGTAVGLKFNLTQGSSVNSGGVSNLFPGSIPGTMDASSSYDGVTGAVVRTRLTAAQTLYVATTGNDATGDGTSAKPWASLPKVWAWLATVDTGGFAHKLNLSAGAFSGDSFPLAVVGGGSLEVIGAGSAQTSLAGDANTGAVLELFVSGFIVGFNKLTIDVSNAYFGIFASCDIYFGHYNTTDIVFKTGLAGTSLVYATGQVNFNSGNIEVKQCGDSSGYAQPFIYTSRCSVSDSATWTWTGPADLVTPCVTLDADSIYVGSKGMTGTVHGQKFALTNGSIMKSGGKGHAYFPGDVAGTVDASSWFDNVSGAPPPTPFMEPLIVTATNVIPPLAHAPINGLMQLIVNGRVFTSVGGVKSRFNPSDKLNVTLSNSDRSVAQVGSAIGNVRSIVSHSTGKWHVEFNNVHSITNTWAALFGLANANYPLNTFLGSDAGGNSLSWSYWVGSEVVFFIAGSIVPGNTYWAAADGDSFAMEVDFDAHLIWIKNITQNSTWNPWLGGAGMDMTGLVPGEYFVAAAFGSNVTNGSMTVNFGATPFAATPQAGFLPWSADVLPAFSVFGTTVTWNSTTWAINPSDEVIAAYSYLPPLDATPTAVANDRAREMMEARQALPASSVEPTVVERMPTPRDRFKLLRHEETLH